MVDFGFYRSIGVEDYHYNMQIEKKLVDVDGIKRLYSEPFFPED